ncbi:tetracycline resistance MFS efflux pump [Niastella vici]|uniref:Tetracycline resistance MFS efflux pump n=2 Tax=Niastella vici TaxID=1703345 RepID=A0A1V9G9I4_9BACT|nr:tetracycline resistance MFS efflux pump [Niastella vici]
MSMKIGRSAALKFIFVTILVDVIGWGLIIPVMPSLISGLKHIPINETSKYGGWLLTVYAIMQFAMAPVLGALSDQYGRRSVLLFSLFGFGIDYLFMAFAPTYEWLFVGRIISGITGASFTTASAYVADISDSENRAKNFGMIGAAFGLGFIIGPAIGGQLGRWGVQAPFIAAAILCLLNWLYGYFILPESLDKKHRRVFEWKRANPFGSLVQLKKYPAISGLILSMVLIYIAAHAVQSNWSYFTKYRFKWTDNMIGYSLSLVGALVAFVQAGLIRKVHPLLGNERSIYIGLVFYSLGMFLFAFASETWMMFVFLVPYCLGGIAGPALQATISSHVPPNAQGELQGILTSLMSLTSIIGPLLMTNLFYYFTKESAPVHFPGAPFFLGAVLMLLSAVFAYRTLYKEKHSI